MIRTPRFAIALALASSLTLAATAARADDASSQAAAQALFDEARKLAGDGKWADACPKFAESQRLDPGAGTLMNLANCYEKNGQTASAWVTFKDAAAAADLKHRSDWAERARERATALEPKLSRLTIEVAQASRVDGLIVRRDGVDVGTAEWGLAIPTDPGDHAIEAIAPHKKRFAGKVTVAASGAKASFQVPALEDEPEAPAPVVAPPPIAPPAPVNDAPVAPPSNDGSSQRTIGLVVGGVGVVGLAVGTIFGLKAMSSENDSKSLCPNATCANPAGVQANDDAKSAATLSTVGMIVGVVGVGTGALLYFTAPSGSSSTGLRVSPQLGPGIAGLRVGGAW